MLVYLSMQPIYSEMLAAQAPRCNVAGPMGAALRRAGSAHDELLVHQRVRGEVAVEQHLLLRRWELAMQEQVGRVIEVPLLSQLLHIILWRHSTCLDFCFAEAQCTRHSPSLPA